MMPAKTSFQEAKPSRLERLRDRNFGKNIPIDHGLALLADYLGGLSKALDKDDLRIAAQQVIPSWEAYVLGIVDRLRDLEDENSMLPPPASIHPDQRAAIIASIRKAAAKKGKLEDTPDELLLPMLHCLTGRNPKNGEVHAIPAGKRIKFKPSKNLLGGKEGAE